MCPCLLLITCARTLSFQAIHLSAQQLTLTLIKTLWFIHVYSVFATLIYQCSFVFKTPLGK